MQTAIVVNQNAYALRRRPAWMGRIEALARGRARVFRTSTLAELDQAASEIAAAGSERVVLCGGDGSFMSGTSALARAFGQRSLPELVLAPGGTVATVAKNWGQRRSLLESVRLSLTAADTGRVSERPTLRVADGQDPDRIGFIFGTGLVARFFDRYYGAGGGGYPAAAKIVARVFAGSFVSDAYSRSVLDPMPCTLMVDGEPLTPSAYSLVCCSVVRDLGLHLLVTYRAGSDFERPHLVASPLSPRALGPQAPRVLLGKPLRGSGVFDDLVTRFSLRFPDGPGPWVLDGDVFRAREVVVSAGPRIRVRAFA